MGFPIVNTPFTHSFTATVVPSLQSKRGIRLHLKMAGNYPRIPGITLGLGLVHYLLRFASRLHSRDGWRLRRNDEPTDRMSPFRWHHPRGRRTLLQRPARLLFTVDDLMRRSHHPRACAPPPSQYCEVIYDGPMQFAFAGPLHLPTLKWRVTATRPTSNQRGLPTWRQATCRTFW
jgi:hypothetical protein